MCRENELIAFITARLDEDYRIARAAAKAKQDGEEWHRDHDPDAWIQGTGVLRPDGGPLAMVIGDYAADHIARHDPARVLREVAAKRAFLAIHRDDGEGYCNAHRVVGTPLAYCRELRHLAAIYSDHPDYRQEWKS